MPLTSTGVLRAPWSLALVGVLGTQGAWAGSAEVAFQHPGRDRGAVAYVALPETALKSGPGFAFPSRGALGLAAAVQIIQRGPLADQGDRIESWYLVKATPTDADGPAQGWLWGGWITDGRLEVDLDGDGRGEVILVSLDDTGTVQVRRVGVAGDAGRTSWRPAPDPVPAVSVSLVGDGVVGLSVAGAAAARLRWGADGWVAPQPPAAPAADPAAPSAPAAPPRP